jgi:putative transposase
MLGVVTETPKEREALARLQQAVARKQKGSANRLKAVLRLARRKAKMGRRRRDALHKISHDLVKNHDVIVLEDLKTRAMTRSARGTAEAPGSGVRQKAGLNREILDRGWGLLGGMIAWKAAWSGKRVITVPAAYSSQECACCGHLAAGNRPSQSVFDCMACGHRDHADVNAARVIRARGVALIEAGGLSASARGVSGACRNAKQEETVGRSDRKDQTSSDGAPAH